MSQCILAHGHNGGYRHLHTAGVLPTLDPSPDITAHADGKAGSVGYCVELTDEGGWVSIFQLRYDPAKDDELGYIAFSVFVNTGCLIPHIKEALDRVLATYDLRTGRTGRVEIPEDWHFVDQLNEVLEEREVTHTHPWIPSERSENAKMYIPSSRIEPYLQQLSLPRYTLYQHIFIIPEEVAEKSHDPLFSILGKKMDTTPDISQEMEFELHELNQMHQPKHSEPASDTATIQVTFTFGKSKFVSPGRTEFTCTDPQVQYNEVTQVISYPKDADVKGARYTFTFADTYSPCSGVILPSDTLDVKLHYSKRGRFTFYKPLLIGLIIILACIAIFIIIKNIHIPVPQQPKPTESRPTLIHDDPDHPVYADDAPGPNDTVGWAIKYTQDYLSTDEWQEDSLQKYDLMLQHYDKQSLLDANQQRVKEQVHANLLFRRALNRNFLTKGDNCLQDLTDTTRYPYMEQGLGEQRYHFMKNIVASPDMRKRITQRRGDIMKADYPHLYEIISGEKLPTE